MKTSRILLAWVPMLLLAIANGAARDLIYGRWIGRLRAHQMSTIILVMVLWSYIGIFTKKNPFRSPEQAMLTGFLWALLTLGFEFGFGIYRGMPWQQILSDYDLAAGRLWLLIPVTLACAPPLWFHFSNRRQN